MNKKNKAPHFTVILPVHNKQPHVAQAVKSVLSQSFKDLELIVIDDASTDNSVYEVERFCDQRIKILKRNSPGPGGYAARNLGIKHAKSDWVAFIDADDEWYPLHLERMYRLSKLHSDVYFLGSGWHYRINGKLITDSHHVINSKKKSHLIDCENYLKLCLSGVAPVHTSTVCINKLLGNAENLFPAKMNVQRGGDLYAWLKLICSHKKLAWSDHLGGIYNRNSVNMTTRTAHFTPNLMSNDIFSKLSTDLNFQEQKLLKSYLNMLLIIAWSGNIFQRNTNNFSLCQTILKNGRHIPFKLLLYCIQRAAMRYIIKLKLLCS